MGMKWGNLARMRYKQFTLSPLEQKAFAGFISKGFPRTYRRVMGSIWLIAVPLGLYLTMNYITHQSEQLSRKKVK